MVIPFKIFEGTIVDADGVARRYTCAVYPPLQYDFCNGWACALRYSFAPEIYHFEFGADKDHAIERASLEARGFIDLLHVDLVSEDGFDFEAFTNLGYSFVWQDDPANHPGMASYLPPAVERQIHATPEGAPIRIYRGWQTINGEMHDVVGAIYPPDRDADGRWGCVVSCPAILPSNKRTPGVDAEDALEFAQWFLIDLWNHFVEPKLEQVERTYAARVR